MRHGRRRRRFLLLLLLLLPPLPLPLPPAVVLRRRPMIASHFFIPGLFFFSFAVKLVVCLRCRRVHYYSVVVAFVGEEAAAGTSTRLAVGSFARAPRPVQHSFFHEIRNCGYRVLLRKILCTLYRYGDFCGGGGGGIWRQLRGCQGAGGLQ